MPDGFSYCGDFECRGLDIWQPPVGSCTIWFGSVLFGCSCFSSVFLICTFLVAVVLIDIIQSKYIPGIFSSAFLICTFFVSYSPNGRVGVSVSASTLAPFFLPVGREDG